MVIRRKPASSNMPPPQVQDIIKELGTDLEKGLTTDEAAARREKAGTFNVVDPPINCPPWVCCLLPCIKGVPSMKVYRQIKPEDAEIMRNSKWIRYDASSLVKGDLIRLDEGDTVPADCVIVESRQDLLVDHNFCLGQEKPSTSKASHLYWGGQVVQGGTTAVVTAIGSETLVASLIRQGKFPPKTDMISSSENGEGYSDEEEAGISLVAQVDRLT